MDDLKLYGSSRKKLYTVLSHVDMFSENIKINFGLDTCKGAGANGNNNKDFAH